MGTLRQGNFYHIFVCDLHLHVYMSLTAKKIQILLYTAQLRDKETDALSHIQSEDHNILPSG